MSWPSATLGSIATIDRFSVQPSSTSGRYIGLEHITSDGAINVDHGINAEDLASSKFSFTPAHILFGKLRPYLRKVARPSFSGICSTDILPIHPNTGVDKDYLFHYLRTPAVIDLATARSSGANLPRISPSILSEFLVPVPPLEEQKRIAAIFDNADAIRHKREQAIKLADEFLGSLFLDMFGDPYLNPKGWIRLPLIAASERFSDGPFGSNLKTEHYRSSGVRVIRLSNIGVGKFVDDDKVFISPEHAETISKHMCFPGEVLIGTLGDPNLRACILPDSVGNAINKADCLRLKPKEGVAEAGYLSALLNLPQTLAMCANSIHGQTRSRISSGQLRDIKIPIPPVGLQREFSRRLSRVWLLENAVRAEIDLTALLNSSLTHRAFRGEL